MEETVSVVQIPGIWVPKNAIVAPVDANDENSKDTFNKLFPVKISSPQFKNPILTIIPVMPAIAPTLKEELCSKGMAPIKGVSSPFSNIKYDAFRSGTRSAIVPSKLINEKNERAITNNMDSNYIPTDLNDPDSILIRLKGCGMWLKESEVPFPCYTLRETQTEHYKGEEKVYEVRGVAFRRTAYTELYSTEIFKNAMKEIDFQIGNEPLGCWVYDKVENDVAPDIDKCVVVMRTFGDKRCETHLLAGLEKIISGISDEEAKSLAEKLLATYEKNKIEKPQESLKVFNREKKLNFYQDSVKVGEKLYKNYKANGNFDYIKQMKESNYFLDPEIFRNDIEKISFTSNGKSYSFLSLMNLYSQIGRDVGTSLACIHRSGFLWGTYCDHSLAEMHCNSHPDNLVILNKPNFFRLKQLLAPVDFDMSFEFRCAVNFWGKKQGEPDPTMGIGNIFGEIICMLDDLLGYSAMFEGVSTAIKQRPQPKGEDRTTIIETMRMALAWEYLMAYESPFERKSWISEEVYDIVEKALEYTKSSNA